MCFQFRMHTLWPRNLQEISLGKTTTLLSVSKHLLLRKQIILRFIKRFRSGLNKMHNLLQGHGSPKLFHIWNNLCMELFIQPYFPCKCAILALVLHHCPLWAVKSVLLPLLEVGGSLGQTDFSLKKKLQYISWTILLEKLIVSSKLWQSILICSISTPIDCFSVFPRLKESCSSVRGPLPYMQMLLHLRLCFSRGS